MYRGVLIYIVFKIGLLLLIRQMLKIAVKRHQEELDLNEITI